MPRQCQNPNQECLNIICGAVSTCGDGMDGNDELMRAALHKRDIGTVVRLVNGGLVDPNTQDVHGATHLMASVASWDLGSTLFLLGKYAPASDPLDSRSYLRAGSFGSIASLLGGRVPENTGTHAIPTIANRWGSTALAYANSLCPSTRQESSIKEALVYILMHAGRVYGAAFAKVARRQRSA